MEATRNYQENKVQQQELFDLEPKEKSRIPCRRFITSNNNYNNKPQTVVVAVIVNPANQAVKF
jgi:hypothetical protein